MKKLIVLADWGGDSLTCQEFRSATEGFLKNPQEANVTFVSSTPSTVHAGFLVRQIVETEERMGRPHDTVIFQNIDPRLGDDGHVDQAKGAEFIVVRLTSGIMLCGPNAGFDFSFIKYQIDQAFIYRGMDRGSQFRSRDLYARVAAHLMDSLEDEMELEEIEKDAIPRLTGHYVGHVDNYGNIKTTVKMSELKGTYEFGDTVEVTIGRVTKKARFVTNLFGDGLGTLVLYPGSTGPKDDPYLEVSIWRHFTEENPTTGAVEFGNPRPGVQVAIKM